MVKDPKRVDLIVFGATGFVGQVAAEYFSKKMPSDVRWAVAGRNRDKLAALADRLKASPFPPAGMFVVDHSNASEVRRLVSEAAVVINYAGPFARSGESIVAACAELGTHYLDITGETLWVRQMIDKYAGQAEKSGAVLIPFSGYDSVPSDLGSWRVAEQAKLLAGELPVTRVIHLVSGRGGVSGGTFETVLDILQLSREDLRRFNDPGLLVPGEARDRFRFRPLTRPVRVPPAHLIAPPFLMEPINSRVVYRAQALRAKSADSAPPFEYLEVMRLPKFASGAQSWALVLGTGAFNRLGRRPWAHALLKKHGIKSGQGPSEKVREGGFFRSEFFAYSGDRLVSRLEMFYPGDPGIKSTALLSCESAICLIEQVREGKLAAVKGGFWTPSTALGKALYERLERAGVRFTEPSVSRAR